MRYPSDAPEWLKTIFDQTAEALENQIASSNLDANAMFLYSGKVQLFRDLKNEIDAVAGKEQAQANKTKREATERATN